jgi:glyoxylase-like metal-dependent hydrolase (beta-lactamase superfamily II)
LSSIRIIVRGWLNCNQIVLLDGDNGVVIDTGHSSGAGETLRLLMAPENLGDRPVARIIVFAT